MSSSVIGTERIDSTKVLTGAKCAGCEQRRKEKTGLIREGHRVCCEDSASWSETGAHK